MQTTRNIIILSLTFFVLGFSGWLYVHNQMQESEQIKHNSNQMNASGLDIRVKQFDKMGRLTYVLTTPEVRHYPKGNMSVFTKPRILVYRPGQPVWHINALKGKAVNGNQKVMLIGKVLIQQAGNIKNPATEIKTSELSYFPDRQVAFTSKPISLHQPGINVTAIGMRAHLNNHHVQLLSKIKAVYHPDQRRSKS